MAGTDDDERTVADRVKATVLELPASAAANDDDEDTTTTTTNADDPTRAQLRPSGEVDAGKPTQVEMPKAVVSSDDDPTQARPPPVMKPRAAPPPEPRAPAPALLAKGRKVEITDEYTPRRRIHPFIPLGVLLAALLALLLAVNWLRSSSPTDGEDGAPRGIHTLFNW